MMKRLFIFLISFFPLMAVAQTADKAEDIKNAADYLWGQGYGATVKEADREALADLMSSVWVQFAHNGNPNIPALPA